MTTHTLGALARGLSADEERTLLGLMPSRRLLPEEALVSAGEPNDSLFFVERGALLITLPLSSGAVTLGSRGPGEWVGEVTLLSPGPASATVTASDVCELRELSAAALEDLIRAHPALAARVLRTLSEDLAHRIRAAGVVLERTPPSAQAGFFRSVFSTLFGGRTP